jgi:hypothetical protein
MWLLDTRRMRSMLLRLTVAFVTFVAGMFVESIHRYVQQQALREPASTIEITAPSAKSHPESSQTYPDYPEHLGIGPREIAFFIEQHPRANLYRLWQRLGLTDDDPIAQFSFPQSHVYKVNAFEYDLNDDAGREVVLQIKQPFAESYRYLVFKESFDDHTDRGWKFLGKIDVWAKYKPSDPVVLLSNGRAWLIVQSTGATGSGLGAWVDEVYEVSNRGVRRVASYIGRVSQAGYFRFPSKVFSGRPLSCEIKNGWAILNVSYTVEYTEDVPLFTKRKTAVLVASLRDGSSFIDTARSEISPHELETIYNFDSMGTEDFLRYNRAELRAIATGSDAKKKKWLKEFLDTWKKSPIKDELLPLIH